MNTPILVEFFNVFHSDGRLSHVSDLIHDRCCVKFAADVRSGAITTDRETQKLVYFGHPWNKMIKRPINPELGRCPHCGTYFVFIKAMQGAKMSNA